MAASAFGFFYMNYVVNLSFPVFRKTNKTNCRVGVIESTIESSHHHEYHQNMSQFLPFVDILQGSY